MGHFMVFLFITYFTQNWGRNALEGKYSYLQVCAAHDSSIVCHRLTSANL